MRYTRAPTQMRREAEARRNPQTRAKPPGEADPAKLPPQAFEARAEIEVTMDWPAHMAAGRIEVR